MADPTDKTQDLLTIEGLGTLTTGTPGKTGGFKHLPAETLATIIGGQKPQIDANLKPRKPVTVLGIFGRGNDEPEPQGAKDILKDILDRVADAEKRKKLEEKQKIAMQAAMRASGYDVTIGSPLDDKQIGFAADFRQKLESGQSLTQIANQNFADRKTAAELAAKAEADRVAQAKLQAEQAARTASEKIALHGKYSAGLVYAGYLDPANAGDTNAAALAMSQMIADNVPHNNRHAVKAGIFPNMEKGDWTPGAAAVNFINEQTAGSVYTRLQTDLESGDPKRIALAQGFMAGRGEKVEITGKIDEPTIAAGQKMITAPLTMPAGMLNADGTPNLEKLFNKAGTGQLHLPVEALSPAEQLVAKAMPPAKNMQPGDVFSREQYIAIRLMEQHADHPGKTRYEVALASENERRAGLKLDPSAGDSPVQAIAQDIKNSLPADKLGQAATEFAAANGGSISVKDIPALVAKLKGEPAPSPETIALQAQQANIPRGMLNQKISLDPANPDFTGNLERIGRFAYALQNGAQGARMTNIPLDINDQIAEMAKKETLRARQKPDAAPDTTPKKEAAAQKDPVVSQDNTAKETKVSFNAAAGSTVDATPVFEKPATAPTDIASLTDAYDQALRREKVNIPSNAPAPVAQNNNQSFSLAG